MADVYLRQHCCQKTQTKSKSRSPPSPSPAISLSSCYLPAQCQHTFLYWQAENKLQNGFNWKNKSAESYFSAGTQLREQLYNSCDKAEMMYLEAFLLNIIHASSYSLKKVQCIRRLLASAIPPKGNIGGFTNQRILRE